MVTRQQRHPIGVPHDPVDAPRRQAGGFHDPARAVRAVGGQLPVRVALLVAVPPAVGMAFDRDGIRHLGDHPHQVLEDRPERGQDGGAAHAEEGRVVLLDQLDSQPFSRHLDPDLALEQLAQARAAQRFAELLGGLLERLLFRVLRLPRARHGLSRKQPRMAGDHGRRVLDLERARVLEVLGHGFPRAGVLADDPEHDEERHHRRHEVGIGHLPGAAVMAHHAPS